MMPSGNISKKETNLCHFTILEANSKNRFPTESNAAFRVSIVNGYWEGNVETASPGTLITLTATANNELL